MGWVGLPDECRMKMRIKKESVMRGQEMIFEESQGNKAGRRFTRNERIGGEMIFAMDRKLDFCMRVPLALANDCLKDVWLICVF